jgi:predicted RNA polymerase sigma factor
MSDNPMVHGPSAGLALLDALDADERLRGRHRPAAVRAHLLELAGNAQDSAAQYLTAAAERPASPNAPT